MKSQILLHVKLATMLLIGAVAYPTVLPGQETQPAESGKGDAQPPEERKDAQPPQPKQKLIDINKETTHVLGPLDDEGFVDYAGAIDQILSEGVTPETNGAIPFWQAVGCQRIPPERREKFFQRIGTEVPAVQNEPLGWPEFARDKLKLAGDAALAIDPMFDMAARRPWKRDEFPQIGIWLDAQEKRLQLVEAAAGKKHFWSPILLSDEKTLVSAELLVLEPAREFARMLNVRCMLHLGEGRVEAAWRDIETTRALARQVARGSTIIEQLVGVAMESIACQAYINLVQQVQPGPREAVRMIARFDKSEPLPRMTRAMGIGERFMFLQASQMLAKEGPKALGQLGIGANANNPIIAMVFRSGINWNVPMRDANEYYNRIVEIGEIASPTKRRRALFDYQTEVEEDLQANGKPSPLTLLTGVGRGRAIGNILKALLLPAISASADAEFRIHDYHQLCRIATALEGYRTLHGDYPESLEPLVPKFVDDLGVDTFSEGKPWHYRREEAGYVLYSVGQNGTDEGGKRNDDLVIRGPRDHRDRE